MNKMANYKKSQANVLVETVLNLGVDFDQFWSAANLLEPEYLFEWTGYTLG